jgi:hypothetical protein
MKLLILLSILFTSKLLVAQSNYNSNFLEHLALKCDTQYSFTIDCHCSSQDKQTYIIISNKNNKFKVNKWIRTGTRFRRKRIVFENTKIIELTRAWTRIGLWNLSSDSLRLNSIKNNDTLSSTILVGGCEQRFELISNNCHKIISCRKPEELQEFIPTNARQKFIDSRNLFLKIFK